MWHLSYGPLCVVGAWSKNFETTPNQSIFFIPKRSTKKLTKMYKSRITLQDKKLQKLRNYPQIIKQIVSALNA